MDKIVIQGGKTLKGEVKASGSKNSCLPLFFSTLLAEGVHTFSNVPRVKDIQIASQILTEMGCDIQFFQNTVTLSVPQKLKSTKTSYELMKQMRAGILCLGPLLSRYGEAEVSLPGGCSIGNRPVDLHIDGFKKMGVQIETKSGYIFGKSQLPLKACEIHLPLPSVGATQNLMMAGVLSQGETQIHGAAREPEIVDLAHYLIKMGASIQGAGTSTLFVKGVKKLTPSSHQVISDRIEVATLLIAAAMTRGHVRVQNCFPQHLAEVILKLKESGFHIQTGQNWIELKSPFQFSSVSFSTAPYPGFPTDVQAQFMALMTQADGVSEVEENIFENRFMHVPELLRLNAHITLDKKKARIYGARKLHGTTVMATDLRASSCLILAGLVAQGETQVQRVYHLDRGYEKLEKKLSLLGAHIQRL